MRSATASSRPSGRPPLAQVHPRKTGTLREEVIGRRLNPLHSAERQDEVGAQGDEESGRDTRCGPDGRLEPAARRKHLANDVENCSGGKCQEEDERREHCDAVSNERPEKCRAASDEAGQRQKGPGRHVLGCGKRGGNGESLRDVMEAEPQHEDRRKVDRPSRGGLPDRQALGKVVESQPCRDHERHLLWAASASRMPAHERHVKDDQTDKAYN